MALSAVSRRFGAGLAGIALGVTAVAGLAGVDAQEVEWQALLLFWFWAISLLAGSCAFTMTFLATGLILNLGVSARWVLFGVGVLVALLASTAAGLALSARGEWQVAAGVLFAPASLVGALLAVAAFPRAAGSDTLS